jgi:poly-gamma-glutamate system protein
LKNMCRTTRVILAGVISLAAFWGVQVLPSSALPRNADRLLRAAQIMEQSIQAIRSARQRAGIDIDLQIDPNRTGLIGPEASPLMTTLGELAAKRSTTNPNLAGYLVYLLDRAGVKPGDRVAIGSSGSFPALLVASLAAAKAMDAHPITILSLGASAYGATRPDFTLLDIYSLLQSEGICGVPPAAVSLGGDRDAGTDYDAVLKAHLVREIEASKVPYINEENLERNVAIRMRIYQQAAPGGIAAFINSGGGFANLGTNLQVLEVRPGLNLNLAVPPSGRGVLFEMAAREVPVIHLLFVKGLVMQAGLPWDPIPLPKPQVIHPQGGERLAGFWLVATVYFTLLLLLAVYRYR